MEKYNRSADPAREKGWDRFKKEIETATYGELLEKTGITETEFFNATQMVFENLPGWNLGGVALELQPSGLQTIRSIACLQSIVDPQTAPTSVLFPLNRLPGQDNYPQMVDPVGLSQASLYVKKQKEAQAMFLPDAILKNEPYPLRAMLLAGTNPVLTFPDAALQRKMFRQLDFLAVADLFMTETAQEADLVLPAADYLDCLELHDYGAAGKPYLGLVNPVAQKGPGWPVWKWIFKLADKLELNDFFPWETNEQALQYKLDHTGVFLEDLKNDRSSVIRYPSDATKIIPRSKIQYFSQDAQDAASAGLPTPKSFELPFYTSKQYPVWLSTGDRVNAFQHSQFRGSQIHLRKQGGPRVDLHPDQSTALGIRSGDPIQIVTRYGKLAVKAHVTDQVRPDCIRMTHGWKTPNINDITGMEYFDPLSGFPWCRALPARIEVCEGQS
nr:molybdopterin dinucleotide binding domain-containing protein [Desulfobacula sp.]